MTEARQARGRSAERRGRLAEALCTALLFLTGWRVLDRRVGGGRGTGIGEIDIVAKRGRTLAFIEVKARADDGTALEAVTESQRQRLSRAAESYLARRPELARLDIRFDVMTLAGWWPRRIADAWRPGLGRP